MCWHCCPVQRWSELDEVPDDVGRCVVTIGNFDGVHVGHRAVLGLAVQRARETGRRAVAVTFQPHPLAVLRPEAAPEPIVSPELRLELMAETGLDATLVLPFTLELAAWSPRRFVEEVLIQRLGCVLAVVGRDTRFGHRNSGDVGTLRELGEELGFGVEVVADLGDAASVGRFSSTWLRSIIAAGDVTEAAAVLGRPHRVTGVVVHGDHRGRLLGYPTANLGPDSVGVVPADGVYAGWLVRLALPVDHPERTLPAAVSVGTNPTFDGTTRRVECYVLDRDDLELYGETVGAEFVRRLRPTLRFGGVEPLLEQMAQDVAECRQVLGESVPTERRSAQSG
jgi:riboflavin kinase/FMN adenylyltransferase